MNIWQCDDFRPVLGFVQAEVVDDNNERFADSLSLVGIISQRRLHLAAQGGN